MRVKNKQPQIFKNKKRIGKGKKPQKLLSIKHIADKNR
jgi:hypothetical protein